VSDALDRLTSPGADLLQRVDAVLMAHGLPAEHAVTGLLRRLGALPADALRVIAAWRPIPVRAAAADLRHTAERYEQQRDLLAAQGGWTGAAGEAFAAHRAALVQFLGDTGSSDEAGLVGRLRATAAYLDDVADWLDRSRDGMARAVADVLGSAEAVHVHASGDAAAAATIAARVLDVAAEAHSCGNTVAERWAGRLDELFYRPPAPAGSLADEARLTR
jgi:hypothetical protein